MSIKVMNRIWEQSRNKGSALLLLLAIADHAHDDGGGAYPSVGRLAHKTRMSVRSTQLLLQKLIASGELSVALGEGPKGANLYRINLKALGGGEKIAGVQTLRGRKDCGVKNPAPGGEKSGAEGVKHVSPKPSCKEGTVIEPSLQQQQSAEVLPAAAERFDDAHKSVFSFTTVEDFVIAKKPHAKNPGGLARMIWRSGQEDSAIGKWLIERDERRKVEERPPAPESETASDFDMGAWIDDLIANNWTAQLENELEQINERGGARLEWEHRVVEYFNRGAATDAA